MQENPSKLKSALNFGALLGLVMLVLTVITYMFSLYENTLFSLLTNAVFIAGLVIGMKKFRDEESGGYISYGGALGYGVLVSLFVGIIACVGTYVYLSFVDSGFIDFTLEQAETAMYEGGQPEEAVEMAMEWTRKMYSPGGIAFFTVLGNVFVGFIVSLIAGAFIKKEGTPFE